MASKKFGLTFLAAAFAGAGCTAGPEIHVDRDPAADLASYRTFGFYEARDSNRSPYMTLLSAHLRAAATAEMQKRNYTYDPDRPDLRVNMVLIVAQRADLESAPAGPFGRRGKVETVRYQQGTLVIDLVDARRNALVWQGVADSRMEPEQLRNPSDTIGRAMSEIFERL